MPSLSLETALNARSYEITQDKNDPKAESDLTSDRAASPHSSPSPHSTASACAVALSASGQDSEIQTDRSGRRLPGSAPALPKTPTDDPGDRHARRRAGTPSPDQR